MWAVCLLALGVGLLLAEIAARQVTRPVTVCPDACRRLPGVDVRRRPVPTGAPELREAHAAVQPYGRCALMISRTSAVRRSADAAERKAHLDRAARCGHSTRVAKPAGEIFSLTKLAQRGLSGDDATADGSAQYRGRGRAGLQYHRRLGVLPGRPRTWDAFDLTAWLRGCAALVDAWLNTSHRRAVGEVLHCSCMATRACCSRPLVNVLINALQATPKTAR